MLNNVCVLMSVYYADRLSFIDQAICSIDLAVVDKVFIGIDGKVEDEVIKYLSELSVDKFVICPFPQNRGLAYVLNDLIEVAMSDDMNFSFFARMDADDICAPERFAKQIQYLCANPVVSCLGSCADIIDETGKNIGEIKKTLKHHDLIKRMSVDSPFIHPTVIFRRHVLVGHKYQTNTIRFEDVELWFEISKAGYIFENLSENLLSFRITSETVERRRGLKKLLNEFDVRFRIARYYDNNIYSSFLRIVFRLVVKFVLPNKLFRVALIRKK